MPKFPDTVRHQGTTASQEEGADSNKTHRAYKTTIGAQLEPGSVGKRCVCRQKHQSKQNGNDDMLRLVDGIGQTFRGLGDQVLAELHGFSLLWVGKSTKNVLIFKRFF